MQCYKSEIDFQIYIEGSSYLYIAHLQLNFLIKGDEEKHIWRKRFYV